MRRNAAAMLILGIMSLCLGGLTVYCILKVGDLNGQADMLEFCRTEILEFSENSAELAKDCPSPMEYARIDSLRNTAKWMGYLGWLSVFLMLFPVGERLMNRFDNKESNDD